MKNLRHVLWVAAVSLCVLVSSAVVANADSMERILNQKVIKIGINSGAPPFTYVGPDGKYTGFVVELGRLIAGKLGVEAKFVDMDWNGLIPALISGRIDIIGERMSATLERQKSIAFADPYFLTGVVLFTRKDAPYKTIDDVNSKDVRIATMVGTTHEIIAKENLTKTTRISFNTDADVLQAISTGRVDVAMEDEMIARGLLAQKPGELRILPGYLQKDIYAFAVNHRDTVLLRWLNMFFLNAALSGDSQRLYKKYLDKEWQPILLQLAQ